MQYRLSMFLSSLFVKMYYIRCLRTQSGYADIDPPKNHTLRVTKLRKYMYYILCNTILAKKETMSRPQFI